MAVNIRLVTDGKKYWVEKQKGFWRVKYWERICPPFTNIGFAEEWYQKELDKYIIPEVKVLKSAYDIDRKHP